MQYPNAMQEHHNFCAEGCIVVMQNNCGVVWMDLNTQVTKVLSLPLVRGGGILETQP